MKLCPQCEFIYEDDQRFCDMDGTELAHNAPPSPGNPSSQTAPQSAKTGRKLAAIGAIVGVILLFSGFYVFTHQTPRPLAPIVTPDPPSVPNAVAPSAAASATPHHSKDHGKAPTANKSAFKGRAENIKTSPVRSRPPAQKREEQKAKPENTVARNESEVNENTMVKKPSRIGSILKKTGRLLKKPFKF